MRGQDPLRKLAEYDVQHRARYNKEKKGVLIFCLVVIATLGIGFGLKSLKREKSYAERHVSQQEKYSSQCERWASAAQSKAITDSTRQYNQLAGLYHNTYCSGAIVPHYPQDVIGEWFSPMGTVDGFAIMLNVDGRYVLRRTFGDGSVVVENIDKQGDQYISNTVSGQSYKVGTDNSLMVYDGKGFVRSLPPASRPKD